MNATTRAARYPRLHKHAGSALSAALALLATSTVEADETSAAWAKAGSAYDMQRYAEALAIYEALALNGDPRAARLAGETLLFAPALNDKGVPYDPVRASGWLRQAAAAGSTPARFLVLRIEARELAEPEGTAPAQTPYEPGPHGC